MRSGPQLTKFTQNEWKTQRPDTVKHVEENIGEKLLDMVLAVIFLRYNMKAKATQA